VFPRGHPPRPAQTGGPLKNETKTPLANRSLGFGKTSGLGLCITTFTALMCFKLQDYPLEWWHVCIPMMVTEVFTLLQVCEHRIGQMPHTHKRTVLGVWLVPFFWASFHQQNRTKCRSPPPFFEVVASIALSYAAAFACQPGELLQGEGRARPRGAADA
jgi:hypothetical protein